MPYLVVENGALRGHRVDVPAGGRIILGRDPRAHISVDDVLCSRKHFFVEERDGRFYLKDLGSSNGTHVNDEPVAEVALASGDSIHAGSTQVTFLDERAEAKQGLVGKEVAGYRLLERIGRGGMGTVYKALQVSLNRVVALKILASRYSRDPAFIEKFKKEAQAAGRLNHPNIVQVYDVGSEGGLHFYSMEYIENGSAQDLVTRDGALDPELALSIITDAARGLEYAERKGLVHRDVKPDNLMINAEGVVKIADLGLAHDARDVRGERRDPDDEGIFGTPHFISPEQAQGLPVDTRSDIYSLGGTFCLLLTGRPPYSGKTVRDIIQAQISAPPPNMREAVRACPPGIAQVVERAMAKQPEDRFQSASELVEHLERLERQMQGGGRRRGLLVAALFAVVLVGGAIAAIVGGGDDPAPPPDPGPQAGPPAKTDEELERERRAREEAARQLRLQTARTELAQLQLEEQRLRERTEATLEALKQRYRERVLEPYIDPEKDADTDVARAVAGTLARLDEEIEALREARLAEERAAREAAEAAAAAVRSATAAVDAAVAQDRFGRALRALDDALASPALDGREEAAVLEERRARLLEGAGDRADELLREAAGLMEDARFEDAENLLASAADDFVADCPEARVAPPVAALATRLREEIRRVRSAKVRKRKLDLEHDQKVGVAARRAAVLAVRRAFDPAAARARLADAAAELRTPEWQELAARGLADLDAAGRLLERTLEGLEQDVGERITFPSSSGRPIEWSLEKVEGDVLTLRVGPITRTTRVTTDLGGREFVRWLVEERVPEPTGDVADRVRTLLLVGDPAAAVQLARAADVDPGLRERARVEQAAHEEMRAIRRLQAAGSDPKTLLELKQRLESFLRDHRASYVFLLNSDGTTPLVEGPSGSL